jgi:hypothetical protein
MIFKKRWINRNIGKSHTPGICGSRNSQYTFSKYLSRRIQVHSTYLGHYKRNLLIESNNTGSSSRNNTRIQHSFCQGKYSDF